MKPLKPAVVIRVLAFVRSGFFVATIDFGI